MVRTHRISKIALTACLVCTPWLGVPIAAQTVSPIHVEQTAHASDSLIPGSLTPGSFTPTSFVPNSRFTPKEPLTSIVAASAAESNVLAQRGWGRGRWDPHSGARAAIILGSVAAIAGGALLVYANRPGCSADHTASGCGYGTKVTGGALVAGGVVSIAVGALTWR